MSNLLYSVALLLLLPTLALAESAQIKGVRMWPAPDNTRLVFDVTAPVEHNLFTLANPDRVVIDLRQVSLPQPIADLNFADSLVKGLRSASRNSSDLRVVLDLKGQVRPKSFVLRPNQEYGHRLVIDLENVKAAKQPVISAVGEANALRDIVIAIDAGHGGEDPGAIGPTGTREKDVVLAIAKRLNSLVAREPGMRSVMIRDGDYYVSLANRMNKAREHRADLFISIHADAFQDRRARGSSVYTLSQRGASSEYARLLADKENSSDLIGGVSLDDKDELLASVLLDLSQTATIQASTDVAARVLGGLGSVGKLHKGNVERAGFRVLKSPDVPSILVETAFISNPGEERQLRSSSHQQSLAQAVMDGVRSYFSHNPPPGTRLARRGREHVISRGDTLTGIARNYSVSLEHLRSVNGLDSDVLKVGAVLRIPPG